MVVDKSSDTRLCCSDKLKTKLSRRALGLFPYVKEELLKHKQKQEEHIKLFGKSYNKDYEEYVCVDALGNIFKPDYVSTHFHLFLENNNLKRIRFHDLRHSCASNLLSNGASIKEIQEWLGHSNISTTANIYTHLDAESKKKNYVDYSECIYSMKTILQITNKINFYKGV